MKREGVRREAELFRDLAGGQSFRPGLYKQAENIEAVILGERGECRDGFYRFHISTNMETL